MKSEGKNTKAKGKGYGAYLKFKPGSRVQARSASSYISPEQTLLNWQTEIGKDKTLEQTRQRGYETWNKLLNCILVAGGTEEQTRTF